MSRDAGAPGVRDRPRSTWWAVLLLFVIASVPTGGREDPSAVRRDFERGLIERERITAVQASCVGEGIFASHRPDEIRRLGTEGLASLPDARWGDYLRLMMTCLFHDELAVPPSTRLTPVPSGPGR